MQLVNQFTLKYRRFMMGEGAYFWLLLPVLIYVAGIAIYPLLFSFGISLFEYRLTDPNQIKTFIGLSNYIKAFNDPVILESFKTTFIFVVGTVFIEIAFGLGLAMLLASENVITTFIRSFLLLPMALPPLVIGLIWKALYNVDWGIIPFYANILGIDLGHGPLAQPGWALPAVMLIDIWEWTPLLMFIFLAGIKCLPIEPYEAAMVDGASRWKSFIYLTLPLLKPTFLVAMLLRTMQSFKVFDIIYASTAGGPGLETTVLNFQIYKVGMVFFDMGYASALANILLFIVVILAVIYVLVLERQQL
jgi:multiple sugar transport system permease protein